MPRVTLRSITRVFAKTSWFFDWSVCEQYGRGLSLSTGVTQRFCNSGTDLNTPCAIVKVSIHEFTQIPVGSILQSGSSNLVRLFSVASFIDTDSIYPKTSPKFTLVPPKPRTVVILSIRYLFFQLSKSCF